MSDKDLYGIQNNKENLNENRLKTILPLSAIKYSIDYNIPLQYVSFNQNTNNFEINELDNRYITLFTGNDITTEHIINNDIFINFPPNDLSVNSNNFESKTVIIPCHNKNKIFELIIRQNNVACCIQNIIIKNPSIKSVFDKFQETPYMLISLYNCLGLKNLIFSDKALIYMIYYSSKGRSKRSKITWNKIENMFNEYISNKKIIYKKNKKDTVQHKKITLFPTDYINGLVNCISKLRIIKYNKIITKPVSKQRNLCDYINNELSNK